MIPGLRRYARAWLRGDAATADDLVQDALERAVGSWRSRRGNNPRAWVYAILHNLLVDHSRKARRRPSMPMDAVKEADIADAPRQEAGLHREDVLRALDDLPEEQRAVILLVTLEDMSYAEAAATLAIPAGTVMSRLARARDRLAAHLDLGVRPRLRRVQ
nr:sigma-70 family RNA polymerase sigma factor [Sphingobium sp. BHU LFT2]